MEQKKKYFIYLDILRLFSCIAVFLYHLNLLKGGYLAVCCFFVLSGFLSCLSQVKKEKFSFKDYYSSRLLKIYLPLVIIVLITVTFISYLSDIALPSLKPELKSILLGYNNFWQLSANMDYFAQHINSPFMHLWYIAILLQFDLVFPLLYIPLRKLGDKCHKSIPCIISILLTILGCIYFYISSKNQSIMDSYYNTFNRIFSLLFGVSIGFIHYYYKPLIPDFLKRKKLSISIFFVYMIILGVMFLKIDASSSLFSICMILASLISCRIIDYSIILSSETTNSRVQSQMLGDNNISPEKVSIGCKIIKYFSSISYEFYILQYPIIFFLQYSNLPNNIKLAIVTPILVILSCLFHYVLTANKGKSLFKYILRILILIIAFDGLYKFYVMPDNTKEMNDLKSELAQNESLIETRQYEYDKKFQEKQAEFEKALQEINLDESKLADAVTNMTAVAMGDSVMENSAKDLYARFPNIYIDAKYCRTATIAPELLTKLINNGKLGDPIIFEFGSNGDCTQEEYATIMDLCKDRQVFWLTVPNDRIVHVNQNLFNLEKQYDNVHIIDWYTMTRPHPEYFVSDKVHLTAAGKKAFVDAIYDGIYDYYKKEFTAKKEALQAKQTEILNNEITFFGNELLVNAYKEIEKDFPEAKYVSKKDYNFSDLKHALQKEKENNSLTHKIVFLFDSSFDLSIQEWNEILEICAENEVTIISTSSETINELQKLQYNNCNLIDCENEIIGNPNYISADRIHLNNEGIIAFGQLVKEKISK